MSPRWATQPLTQGQVVRLHRAYMNGESTATLAASCGLSRQRLYQIFNKYGMRTRSRGEAAQIRFQEVRNRTVEQAGTIDELFNSYAAGDTPVSAIVRIIAEKLGLPYTAVRDQVAEKAAIMAHSKSQASIYTDEELCAFLREAAGESRKLTTSAYSAYAQDKTMEDGRPWPIHLTITIRFDKWSNAIERAGLQPVRRKRKRISAEECVAGLRQTITQIGHIPTVEEYRQIARAEGLPSPDLTRIRCGSWGQAVKHACYGDDE